MGPLAAVERFLERLFERQTARLFKTAIRPLQVQRRLERAMEEHRVRDGSRTIVPHRFTVRLTPPELTAVRAAAPSLAADLADSALAFARGHGYTLLDRPTVALRADPTVEVGAIVVDAANPAARSGEADIRSDLGPAGAAGSVGSSAPDGADAIAGDDVAGAPARGPAPSPQQTAVFVVPDADGPRATLREIRADGTSRTIAFDGRPLTIGRAPDNGLVVRDGRASRHHARIDARRGTLILSDLGSTNGSFVNDRRIEAVALGAGDRIRIGTTSLVIEAVDVDPAAPPPVAPGHGGEPGDPIPRDAPAEPPAAIDG